MPWLKLENFDEGEVASAVSPGDAMEEARLQAYESGYSAGWEDAVAAQADDQSRIGADLARHLQSLGFTYQEARMHVLRALEPLLLHMVGHLLPRIARDAMAPVLAEVMMPLAATLADAPVSLVLNPAARAAVEPHLTAITGLPLGIVEEPTLGEGQAYLRLGQSEIRVDLDRAADRIARTVQGFLDLSRAPDAARLHPQERDHG